MKWLITGAGGLIGRKLAEQLAKQGEYVIGVDIKGNLNAKHYNEFYTASVDDYQSFSKCFKKQIPILLCI